MAKSAKLKEQREHQRFVPKDWVCAFCQVSFIGNGKLVDVSRGGAAIVYVQKSAINLALMKKPLKMDLFATGTPYSVKELECDVIYDAEVPTQTNLLDGLQLRRCGVQFTAPTLDQTIQLNTFIMDFTV